MNLAEVKQSNWKMYWFGPIKAIHEIAEYAFVEYEKGETSGFSIFIKGEYVRMSAKTLDLAMVAAIAYKYGGHSSLIANAGRYFMNMIGDETGSEYNRLGG